MKAGRILSRKIGREVTFCRLRQADRVPPAAAQVAPGDHSGHADRRFREAAAMQQVRKPERARDPQAPSAAQKAS